ncbi:sn-glycerol-3-phosphate ABC transporter ATP-binding protein UgpC [Kaistia dalseonensis]|uniref:Multiple sugar transport system ATP-binding protein n=1 Tax=Kaistia dalseonensis TaxID=410840 RepID=A0ABU0H9V7_9HYPH|nr:sn-glycerol-3-phosphate ABC transporter ATP-binding protein UgpC [Kaistia dalseonensis]MCX5496481.1 sn-glycerol-3-phosphate ABC transporter ATP-binding protein UgpC [Kaistia dalseonensis]MDQ0439103.1 multiple sugar transport system ATP-binding protein [Kaistia dalseonensis]
MATRIELRQIVKSYGTLQAIHGIDLTIEPGEFTVFVGPSGCGKSTLLRMIAGLEEISGGDLFIDADRMNGVPASKRGIAMVFQSYALYPHMSVYKNLAFGLETAGYKRAEIDQRVAQAADILQIQHLLQRRPKALSGGQRQRVAIGRAIVREPKIFLFDEPLSNLDAELRVQMRLEIAKLHQTLGNTMIYVTHDQVEAMTMADKIVVLRDGRVMQVGAPLDLYNRPANQFVAGFLGSPKMNFLPARLDSAASGGHTISVAGRTLDLGRRLAVTGPDEALMMGVRPEHVVLGENAGPASLGLARVQHVEQLGGETILHTALDQGDVLTVSSAGQLAIRPGSMVPLGLDPAFCHLFGADGRVL